MIETNLYNPSREVMAIHQRYSHVLHSEVSRPEEMDRWQLDLLYHYVGQLDEAGQRRARKTIKFLETRITNHDYRIPSPKNWQVGGIAA